MAVVVEQSATALARRAGRYDGAHVQVRVRLDGLDRLESARQVTEAMVAEVGDGQRWRLYPTVNGTYLDLAEASTAGSTMDAIAARLTSAGFHGSIRDGLSTSGLSLKATKARPIAVAAAMAFTIDPPLEHGPFLDNGVVEPRWGVPSELTAALALEWADWAVPADGSAMLYMPSIDLTCEDAADVLAAVLEEPTAEKELYGGHDASPAVRLVRARDFGEARLTETGTGTPRITQAHTLLTERVLPHAARLDYATIRVNQANAQSWVATGPAGHQWKRWTRQLWPQYAPDPNGIQILTDAHLDKAHDLTTNWDVTEICPGRWLVQAKDLTPWFGTINETSAESGWQYLDPDLLAQARHDFGDMILTRETAHANKISGPRQQ